MATAAEKSYQLQLQMKQNTEEMSAFLRDMSEWTSDMKKKDDKLKQTPDEKGSSAALPPIRSQPKPRKKKKKADSSEDGAKKKGSKIKGFDYRAWDRFDVDAALKEVDGGGVKEAENEAEEEGSTDEEELERMQDEARQQQAVYQKEKGNDFFKKGKWEDAVECYTKGLQYDSLNAVLFANRAMALLKLQKYAAAIMDCDCSIELDDTYTKAYLRRATAHLKLDKKQEALDDFKKVLEFEPENKLALSTVKKLEVELEPEVEYTPRQPGDITNKKRTKPLSDKPMRRIHIEEISVEEYEKFNIGFNKNNIIEILESDILAKSEKTKSSNVKDNSGEAKKTTLSTAKPVPATKPSKPIPVPARAPAVVKVEYVELPTQVPANSLQFNSDVRKLKSNPEKLFEYVKQIDPDVYPKLFQQSLEADQLFMFLEIFEKFYIPRKLPIYQELYYLTRVQRFSMAIMFKTKEQEQTIGALLKYLLQTSDAGKEAIVHIIKEYGSRI